MRALNVFLSILVSVLLALLVFEGGLRLLGKGPVETGIEFHPRLGWAKKQSFEYARKTREFDIAIATNELGLREDSMASPAKPANTFRVVCLGDSFTLGWSVAREDLFVEQLEGWWGSENRRVDVINAGTQAYSTDQEVLWLLDNGEAFQPDLVLLFPYDNDYYWNGQLAYHSENKPRFRADGTLETGALEERSHGWLRERTALGRTFGGLFAEKSTAHDFVPPGGTATQTKEIAPLLVQPPEFLADALARTRGSLRALQEKCQALGARLIVAPIPSHSAVDPDYKKRFGEVSLRLAPGLWSPDRPADLVLGMARELGIETLDCRSVMRAHVAGGKELYYGYDWHWNAAGNEAFATYLHDELDALRVFPAEHGPTRAGAIPVASVADGRGVPTWLKVFAGLWVVLTGLYMASYRDEPLWRPPLVVAGMLGLVFTMVIGGGALLERLPRNVSLALLVAFVTGLFVFIAYKLGRRIATIFELFVAFVLRGHWYLIPLVVVLLTIGSLLVVAASSPLVAPFIYTLF